MALSTGPKSIWRDPPFVLFWAARMVAITGSTITAVVLPILVFQLTGSALQTSLLATLEVLPYFAFGLFAGALADRVDRRALMIICTLIQAALLSTIPIASQLGILSLAQIYIVALLSLTAFVWFDAANFGALPALVGRDQVVEANSAIWSASTVVGIIVPAIGGTLAALIGAANAIALDVAGFLIAAAILAIVPRTFNAPRTDEHAEGVAEQSIVARTMADIREGLIFVWQHRLIRALTLVGLGNSFSAGAVIGLIVVYAVRALGLPPTDGRIGLLYTATAVGGLAVSLLLPHLARRISVGRITLIGLFAHLAALVGLALAPNFWAGLVLIGLWDGCNTLVIINGIALRQRITPDHLQARVNTTARMIAWGGQPFGAAIGGALAEALDVRSALLIVSVGVGLSALLGWFSPLREPAPDAT